MDKPITATEPVCQQISMATDQTPSTDEDHMIRLKAPEKAIRWTLSFIVKVCHISQEN